MKLIYRLTGGIPPSYKLAMRSLFTHCLLAESHSIDRAIVKKAGKEVITPLVQTSESKWQGLLKPVLVGGYCNGLLLLFSYLKSASWSVLDPLNAVQPQTNKGCKGPRLLVNHAFRTGTCNGPFAEWRGERDRALGNGGSGGSDFISSAMGSSFKKKVKGRITVVNLMLRMWPVCRL